MPSIGVRALEIFESYIGQRETRGYNRSPIIDRWNRIAGVPLGSSYCEAAAYSMFDSAARELNVPNPFTRTASCSRQLKYAAMIGSGLEVIPISRVIGGRADIQRGDHMIHRRGGGSEREIGTLFLGHAGIADTVVGSTLYTVEANTSPGTRGSQRNGDGVWDRARPLDWWLAAIRVPS